MVPKGGYLWWYLDGLSDDQRFGITVIAFIGSVFSPYYAWSGRQDPLNHCSINVALYGGKRGWAMTERGRKAVERDATRLQIGPSAIGWQDGDLVIEIDEWTAPIPRRLRGTIRLTPGALPARSFDLDAAGRHRWQPIAPQSRVTVALDRPNLYWSGNGYLDSNHGDEALEDGFLDWSWSRAHRQQDTVVLYDAKRRDGSDGSLALRFDRDGAIERLPPPPMVTLPPTLWRVARPTRAHGAPILQQTLEDAPFYSRNLLDTPLYGEMATAFHESLDLTRFRHPLVKLMLPFRMPRALF